ncbi:MAG: ribosome-binding factor A [Patescibacteria group bacterium]|jgi:ribosome-binding factor A
MSTNRIDKLNSLFMQEISQFYMDDLADNFFSITKVDISPELNNAKVWVSFINKRGSNLESMQKRVPELRHELSKRLKLRYIPRIELLLDTGIEYASHITELLDENKR